MWRAKKEGEGRKRGRGEEKRGKGEEKGGKRKKKGGEGKKKAVQGREESIFKGAGEGFQQCYVLKTFPSTLKDEDQGRKRERGRRKGERGRKKCAGKGKIFQRRFFNNVMS